MIYRFLADLTLVLHLAFVVFVVLGGLLVLRFPRTALLHLPAAVWGVLIEMAGWVCPLTPLEVRFRVMGGEAGYSGGFIDHYLVPILYPQGLTRTHQLWLGILVALLNLVIYGLVVLRMFRNGRGGSEIEG